jgi:hypothetical protein
MFDLSHQCEVRGCFTQATFRWSLGCKATRCSAHKEEGMVTRALLCRQPGCKVEANYGYAGVGWSRMGVLQAPFSKGDDL